VLWFSATLEGVSDQENTGGSTGAAEALAALSQSLSDCSGCGLAQGRTQVVFGVGNPDADLMFVGEGPGFHEDKQGEPFVGQAGKLLTELLGSIGLSRADVYIANVVKCRPPENRDPAPDEIEACSPHLFEQIGIIRPQVICTLGRFATKLLADTELSMTAIHGKAKQTTLAGVDALLFPVFHPAAALYAPSNRLVLQEDFAKLGLLLSRGENALSEREDALSQGENALSQGALEAVAVPMVAPEPEPPVPSRPGQIPQRREQLPLW
jgi:uracil-DNA glycosylase family 4